MTLNPLSVSPGSLAFEGSREDIGIILLPDLVEVVFGYLGCFLPSNAFRSTQARTIDLSIGNLLRDVAYCSWLWRKEPDTTLWQMPNSSPVWLLVSVPCSRPHVQTLLNDGVDPGSPPSILRTTWVTSER